MQRCRRYVEHAHRKLLGPVFGGVDSDDALGRVWVEIDLEAARTRRMLEAPAEEPHAGTDPRAASDLLARTTLDALVAKTALDAEWITGRWIVLAVPGAGKTTMLRRLARALAADGERLPV